MDPVQVPDEVDLLVGLVAAEFHATLEVRGLAAVVSDVPVEGSLRTVLSATGLAHERRST